MTALTYYVASSLDGYIADKDGGVSWLDMVDLSKDDHGYKDFYEGLDSLIMGRITYEQVLSFGKWPYPDKPCWVMTSKDIATNHPEIRTTSNTPDEIMQMLRENGHQKIWLVGGGKLAKSFHDAGLISEYCISIVPIVLGEGIPLLSLKAKRTTLKRLKWTPYASGIMQLWYRPMSETGESSSRP
ncbi:MAG: dihydrofolate reductase family protein [Nitrospiria bacterium]